MNKGNLLKTLFWVVIGILALAAVFYFYQR